MQNIIPKMVELGREITLNEDGEEFFFTAIEKGDLYVFQGIGHGAHRKPETLHCFGNACII
jgi:hypothetical protein